MRVVYHTPNNSVSTSIDNNRLYMLISKGQIRLLKTRKRMKQLYLKTKPIILPVPCTDLDKI